MNQSRQLLLPKELLARADAKMIAVHWEDTADFREYIDYLNGIQEDNDYQWSEEDVFYCISVKPLWRNYVALLYEDEDELSEEWVVRMTAQRWKELVINTNFEIYMRDPQQNNLYLF